MAIDPVAFAADLIRCPSVTPKDAGALDTLQGALETLGFACTRLPFGEDGTDPVDNLYARLGTQGPNVCFAGHTDVVPVGTASDWQVDPFAGETREQSLWGRGAADMKGAIAAFVGAVSQYLETHGAPEGSISLLITGDEEGPSINGTRKMLGWLEQQGEIIDDCLVGEPTNPDVLGDMIKIGRRGSVNAVVTVKGTQGHVAYPHLADNPIPKLVAILSEIEAISLDEGTDWFQPSNIEVTDLAVGNKATNVIPAKAEARLSIRFNDLQRGEALVARMQELVEKYGGNLTAMISGEAFLTPPGELSAAIAEAVEGVMGIKPEPSTTGGTSDARFLTKICPVVEFGLCNATMHKLDEAVAIADLTALTEIYRRVAIRILSS